MNDSEARLQRTFRALMWAMSYPGRVQALPVAGLAAFVTVAETLIDLETSYYTPRPDLDQQLARSGARCRPPAAALYHFYPRLCAADLEHVKVAPVGDYVYPDASATLVIGCALGEGVVLRLRGPGVDGSITALVGGLPDAFWSLRAETLRYPLGWDVMLLANDRILGLPRTTVIERL